MISSACFVRFGALACLLAAFAGCGSPSQPAGPASGAGAKRFVFVTNGDDPFWDACNAGLVEGAKRFGLEAKGLRVVMEKNNGTAQGQIEKLRQFGSQSDIAGVPSTSAPTTSSAADCWARRRRRSWPPAARKTAAMCSSPASPTTTTPGPG
jgi:ABC-type sugar transport system substrate-binding protein